MSKKKNRNSSTATTGRVIKLNPKDELDEFVIDRLLGAGLSRTAEVYRTADDAALKLFVASPARGIRFDKFKSEARMLALLSDSPHIVTPITEYREAGKHNGEKVEAHYYVMEWMHTSLENYLIDNLEWTLESKLAVLEQVVTGLIDSHNMNIFHRDLYTPNILLNIENDSVHAKLCDFGSAKHLDTTSGPYVMPTGNTKYSSPEACAGLLRSTGTDKDLFIKGDAYSLGLLIYEVVAGTELDKLKMTLAALAHTANGYGLFSPHCQPSKNQDFLSNVSIPILERTPIDSIILNNSDGGEAAGKKLDELIDELLKPKHEERLMDLNIVKLRLAEIRERI